MTRFIDTVKLAGKQGQGNILNERKTPRVLIQKKNGKKGRKSMKYVLAVKELGKKYEKTLQKARRNTRLQKIT